MHIQYTIVGLGLIAASTFASPFPPQSESYLADKAPSLIGRVSVAVGNRGVGTPGLHTKRECANSKGWCDPTDSDRECVICGTDDDNDPDLLAAEVYDCANPTETYPQCTEVVCDDSDEEMPYCGNESLSHRFSLPLTKKHALAKCDNPDEIYPYCREVLEEMLQACDLIGDNKSPDIAMYCNIAQSKLDELNDNRKSRRRTLGQVSNTPLRNGSRDLAHVFASLFQELPPNECPLEWPVCQGEKRCKDSNNGYPYCPELIELCRANPQIYSDDDCDEMEQELEDHQAGSGNVLARDIPPSCFCTTEGGVCSSAETCVDPYFPGDKQLAAYSELLSKRQEAGSFCMCATFGNGTCIQDTEYCKKGESDAHQPLCLCAVDYQGQCKDGTNFCSDSVPGVGQRDLENDERWCMATKSADGKFTPQTERCSDVLANTQSQSTPDITTRQTLGKDCVCMLPSCREPSGVWCFSSAEPESICDCHNYGDCSTAAKMFCHFALDAENRGQNSTTAAEGAAQNVSSIVQGYSQSAAATTPLSKTKIQRDALADKMAPLDGMPETAVMTWEDGETPFGFLVMGAEYYDQYPPPWDPTENKRCLENVLNMTLNDGILKDSKGRTGYVASNNQLQFDNPPQHNALFTGGFWMNSGALGLGPNSTFSSCASGEFANLYNAPIADYCQPVWIQIAASGDCPDSDEGTDSE